MAESDERLSRYLKQLDDADKDDTARPARVDNLEEKISAIKERRARLEEHRAELWPKGPERVYMSSKKNKQRLGSG